MYSFIKTCLQLFNGKSIKNDIILSLFKIYFVVGLVCISEHFIFFYEFRYYRNNVKIASIIDLIFVKFIIFWYFDIFRRSNIFRKHFKIQI